MTIYCIDCSNNCKYHETYPLGAEKNVCLHLVYGECYHPEKNKITSINIKQRMIAIKYNNLCQYEP